MGEHKQFKWTKNISPKKIDGDKVSKWKSKLKLQ